MIRYSLEKDNILDNFKKSELMWFMKILYKENKQLKDKLKGVQEERDYLFNKTSVENKYLQQDRDKYKEVIEEIWDFIKKYPGISQSGVMTIKEILDKVKEVK